MKEQALCTLWNLSVDDHLRVKISNSVLLPALITCLDDEDVKVKEASGGVLANLALNQSNHSLTVEEGIIPKLVGQWDCFLPLILVHILDLVSVDPHLYLSIS